MQADGVLAAQMALRAVKAGATAVVEKPYRDKQLLDAINTALESNAAGNN
jgi:FixJ family two-component response regulator